MRPARWCVCRFPSPDRVASKNQPALVLSDAAAFNNPSGHLVLAMITSARNAPWPLDCAPSRTSKPPACPRPRWCAASCLHSMSGSSGVFSVDCRSRRGPRDPNQKPSLRHQPMTTMKTPRKLIEVVMRGPILIANGDHPESRDGVKQLANQVSA